MKPTFAIAFITKDNVPTWLPDNMREEHSDGSRDYRSYLAVKIGDSVEIYSDYGEPEDNSFGRDWSWVSGVIEAAYKQGRKDEANERSV